MLDSNGTRHHLILGRADWLRLAHPPGGPMTASSPSPVGSPPSGYPPVPVGSPPSGSGGPAPNTAFDRTGHELTLAPLPMIAPEWPVGPAPSATERRGAAADANGNFYWIDSAETAILVQSAATGSRTTFWSQAAPPPPPASPGQFGPSPPPATAPTPVTLRGLAVTSEEYLVTGTLSPGGLLVFDLRAPGLPTALRWPESLGWRPVQLSATPDGGLLALDVSLPSPRYWRLDRLFNVVSRRGAQPATAQPGAFAPMWQGPGGSDAVTEPPPTSGNAAALSGSPVVLGQLASGTVLVLDEGASGRPSTLGVYVDDVATGAQLPLGHNDMGEPIHGVDMTLGPPVAGDDPNVAGHAYVVSATRQQAFDFVVTEDAGGVTIRLAARHLPLRGFGGVGLTMSTTGPAYDSGGRWVPLAAQPQSLYATSATLQLGPFDGRQPACVWHRLMLDAVLPPRCSVSVMSRAADDTTSLGAAPWQVEPPLGVRSAGSEEPYVELPENYTTSETLFQAARGRYLELKIELKGDVRTTPRVRALRAYYPRFSYLRNYLPAVYRSDPTSASFLDRYLANVEGINTHIEDLIAAAQMLLDPLSAPADALDWLADFFDVALDPAWTEPKRRLFIAHAMDFFAWRGTIRGLQIAVRLALDPSVDEELFASPPDPQTLSYRIVELFNDPIPGAVGPRPPASAPAPTALASPPGAPAPPAGTPAAAAARDAEQWTQFLTLRYRRLGALNQAYTTPGQPYASFADVPLPAAAPPGGAELADWLDFTSVVAPATGQAHRFILLVPKPLAAASDPTNVDPGGLRALAKRIVCLNKPAHTVCEIRYYWSAFQVGGAQLGHGTAIDVGSRAPQLQVPAQLGRDYAGASYLGGPSAPYLNTARTIGRGATLDA